MIFQLTQTILQPGAMSGYLESVRLSRSKLSSASHQLRGEWTADTGELNSVWSLEELPGEQESKCSQLSPASGPGQEMLQTFISSRHVRFLAACRAMREPAFPSNIYEIRIYRMRPATGRPWVELLMEYLPKRERYSPLIGIWLEQAPSPDTVIHLWSYRDPNMRHAVRKSVLQEPFWREFIARNNPMLSGTFSCLLTPTEYSPLS